GKGGDKVPFRVQERLGRGVSSSAGQGEDAGVRGDAERASGDRAEASGVGAASRDAACALPRSREGADARIIDRVGGEPEAYSTSAICARRRCGGDSARRGGER